jgi:hypothetical protein
MAGLVHVAGFDSDNSFSVSTDEILFHLIQVLSVCEIVQPTDVLPDGCSVLFIVSVVLMGVGLSHEANNPGLQ